MKKGKKTMKKASVAVNALRVLFVLLVLALIVYFLLNRERFTVDGIINMLPENLLLAAAVILLLYSLKSLTVFFPIIVIQISVGLIFSPALGVLINLLGAFCEALVPYLLARTAGIGADTTGKMMRRYPKIEAFVQKHAKNQFFLSFFLRILGFLPLDVVSALLGILEFRFPKYMTGSLLGMLPGILFTTLLGASIMNPWSVEFWVSMLGTGTISFGSLIVYIVLTKKKDGEKPA